MPMPLLAAGFFTGAFASIFFFLASSFNDDLLDDFLSSFMKTFLKVHIHLEFRRFDEIYNIIEKGNVDLVIVAFPESLTCIEIID
ncbi:MAG: hypothetical protein ACI9FB_001789 [Candidatus Azotimanducaceae bacterium]|jgi:hypothetical protein